MALAAGRLRHRVTLQRFVSSRDSDGVLQEGWEDVADLWAAIEPASVRAFIAAGAEQSKVTGQIVIRSRRGVKSSMRMLHRRLGDISIYNIEGVLADKESGIEYMTLPVSTGVNEGQ